MKFSHIAEMFSDNLLKRNFFDEFFFHLLLKNDCDI